MKYGRRRPRHTSQAEFRFNDFLPSGGPRRAGVDDLLIPRCPICGYPLVARQGLRGPYFYCLCTAEKRAA
jgi:hypothetical protein